MNLNLSFARPPQQAVSPAQPPLLPRDLLDLFDVLELELQRRGCGHGFSATLQFLLARGLPVPPALSFLKAHGGQCDCTVLSRVERNWLRPAAGNQSA